MWPWSSREKKVENDYSRLWEDIERQVEEIEREGIELETVRRFGAIAEGVESGDSFKARETHRYFEKHLGEEHLARYCESGLLQEMDFGDHTNFYLVTDRGEYAVQNTAELGEQIEILQQLEVEEGEGIWKLGETDEKVQTNEYGEVLEGVRGDLKEDYVVEVGGGLLGGGLEKKLTDSGEKVKELLDSYRQTVVDGLLESNPYPDPTSLDPVEIILVEADSAIGSRLKRVEEMMADKRKAYQAALIAGDSSQDLQEIIDDWHDIVEKLEKRQSRLSRGESEIEDEGSEYLSKLEQLLDRLEMRSTVRHVRSVDTPHPTDFKKIEKRFEELESIYTEKIEGD